MDAELERDLLLARRLKLAVRLVFYPLLIGGVLFALHVRHAQAKADAAPKGRPVVLRNFTGDHALGVTHDDQLAWLQVATKMTCDSGRSFTWRLRFPARTITQRGDEARAVLRPYEGKDDNGQAVSYGTSTAVVEVGVAQLDVRVRSTLRWEYEPGRVTACTTGLVPQTLSVIGA